MTDDEARVFLVSYSGDREVHTPEGACDRCGAQRAEHYTSEPARS